MRLTNTQKKTLASYISQEEAAAKDPEVYSAYKLGWGWGENRATTAALLKRGLIHVVGDIAGGSPIYRITDAGRKIAETF